MQKQIIKFPIDHLSQKNLPCIICHNIYCQQSVDHSKITSRSLHCLIENNSHRNQSIEQLKESIHYFFNHILHTISDNFISLQEKNNHLFNIQKTQHSLLQLVKKLQYWHILQYTTSLKNIQGYLLGFTLSKRNLIQLVKSLSFQTYSNSIKFQAFHFLYHELNIFLQNLNFQFERNCKDIQYNYIFQAFGKIICLQQKKTRQFIIQSIKYDSNENSKIYKDIFQKDNPQISKFNQQIKSAGAIVTQTTLPSRQIIFKQQPFIQQPYEDQIVFVQGIPMACNRDLLQLSFAKINDNIILKYTHALNKFKNVQQLNVRNNNLSELGYLILLGNYPWLKILDLRSCNINNFMTPLLKNCRYIKILYIASCRVQDYHFLNVCQSLSNLNAIFCGQNQISFEVVKYIAQNQKNIRNISLIKNKIKFSQRQKYYLQDVLNQRNGFFDY